MIIIFHFHLNVTNNANSLTIFFPRIDINVITIYDRSTDRMIAVSLKCARSGRAMCLCKFTRVLAHVRKYTRSVAVSNVSPGVSCANGKLRFAVTMKWSPMNVICCASWLAHITVPYSDLRWKYIEI